MLKPSIIRPHMSFVFIAYTFLMTLLPNFQNLHALVWQGFSAPTSYTGMGTPVNVVVVADFNNSGFMDFAVTDGANHNIVVFINNGNYTFTSTTYSCGAGVPQGLAAGDLNGINGVDLVAVCTGSNTINVFRNNGSGVFTVLVPQAIPANAARVVLADFTGDAVLDAGVTFNVVGNNVVIYPGLNNGTFNIGAPINLSTGSIGNRGIIADNFAHNGQKDIAVCNLVTNSVYVFINNPPGTFAAPVQYSVGGISGPICLASGFVTAGPGPDIVVANTGAATITILSNTGVGAFVATPQSPITVSTGIPRDVAIADFTGDGNVDIIVTNPTQGMITLMRGGPTFATQNPYPAGTQPLGISYGQFTSDSFLDVVVTNNVAGVNGGASVLFAQTCLVDADCPTCQGCTGGLCMNNQAGMSCGLCVVGGQCDNMGGCTGGTPVMCTMPQTCQTINGAMCVRATGLCSYPNAPDGTMCSTADLCLTGSTCTQGVCTGGTMITCPPPQDQCHVMGACTPQTGMCTNPNAPDGTMCSTGNACLTGSTCQTGSCTGGTMTMCLPQDQCHVSGICNSQTGICTNPNAPDGTTCTLLGCTSANCQTGTCTCAASPGPLPPTNFSGAVVINEFLTQLDRIHKLFWTASPDPTVIGYKIYRGTVQIATVPASGPFVYLDHNQTNKYAVIYTIRSFNASGAVSAPLSVSLQ